MNPYDIQFRIGLEQAGQSDIRREGFGRRVEHAPDFQVPDTWAELAKISGISGVQGLSGTQYDVLTANGVLHQDVTDVIDGIAVGGYCLFEPYARKLYRLGPARGMFPVDVVADGGSQGNASATCSLTYTASYSGTQIGTSLSPQWARISGCKMLSGTHGFGHMIGTLFVLDCVDEVPETKLISGIGGLRISGVNFEGEFRDVRVLDASESYWSVLFSGVQKDVSELSGCA